MLLAMNARRTPRTVQLGVGACALALALVASGGAASAQGPAGHPAPRPESVPPADSPQVTQRGPEPGQLVLSAADTRTIPQRLAAAGADPALGSRVSALVIDPDTGATVYQRNSTLSLLPASNMKLDTAFVALSSMSHTQQFTTTVRTNAAHSVVWIVGGGDPALSATSVRALASATRSALVAKGVKTVAVRVDDSIFPAPTSATGWKASYVPGDVAPVRALVVDGHDVMDTSIDAALGFGAALKRLGIGVSSTARASASPATITLSSVRSPYVRSLAATLINTSNNDYGENLHRQSARLNGKGATWSAANAHALATIRARGAITTGSATYDGSGLSRSDRLTAQNLASLLRRVHQTPTVRDVLYSSSGMPTAGVSGTLKDRFATADTRCARGKVRAKTGWLSDVVSLSGTAYGVDGKQRIFAIIENGAPDPARARLAIERFATAATGCNPG